MKKVLLGLVLLMLLTGCLANNNTDILSHPNNDTTTYKEVIKDGKVDIDGISYDIKSEYKHRYVYDNDENLLCKTFTVHKVQSQIADEDIRVYP